MLLAERFQQECIPCVLHPLSCVVNPVSDVAVAGLDSERNQAQALRSGKRTRIATENVPACLGVHPTTLDIIAGGFDRSTMILSCEQQKDST